MLIQFVDGVSPDDILVSNGLTGPAWERSARRVTDAIEKALLRGARAHFSSKDKSDHEMVITIGLATTAGMQIGSVHVHVNGTFKFFPSLAGRQGGYDANIARAQIEVHINNSESNPTNEGSDNSKPSQD
ncbi:hypothetical protein APSETT444_005504 [Aspergillus pseudonomiae]